MSHVHIGHQSNKIEQGWMVKLLRDWKLQTSFTLKNEKIKSKGA